jgi:hypothetical protein
MPLSKSSHGYDLSIFIFATVASSHRVAESGAASAPGAFIASFEGMARLML